MIRIAACLLMLLACSGCRWNQWFMRQPATPTPVVFQDNPTLEQIVQAMNTQSGRVQRLQTQGATLRVPNAPAVTADLAMERPRNFRFRAGTTITGAELDLGSNGELFWFWARLAPQPALFYARHEQFATSRARQFLAIDPSWLIEGIGLPDLPADAQLEGPIPAGGDRFEIRGRVNTPAGPVTKAIVLHNRFAWVLEQRVYDAQSQLIAASRTSNHQYYPTDQVALAQHIEVQVPSAQLQFSIDVDRYLVNNLQGDPASLFALPQQQLGNYPLVDIADPNFSPNGPPPSAAPVSVPQAAAPPPQAELPPTPPGAYRMSRLPDTEYQPRYRGMPQKR